MSELCVVEVFSGISSILQNAFFANLIKDKSRGPRLICHVVANKLESIFKLSCTIVHQCNVEHIEHKPTSLVGAGEHHCKFQGIH